MRTSLAIRIHQTGGPEVLGLEAVPLAAPGPGEALVRHEAVGVNFIDVYHRTGLYAVPLPSGLGSEAAGVVEAVGPGVTEVAPGDRVAYATGPLGAYSERRVMPAAVLLRRPDGVAADTAAALLLKGLTVWYLIRRLRPLGAGETVVITAAAGGVGLLFCQWAQALGARVIGTVSSAAKAELARQHGCAYPLVVGEGDVAARVRALTGGAGVPVVYDSVGRDSFAASLDCLAPRGLLVSFGQASGPVPPLDVRVLADKGSLFLTRPSLRAYTAARADLEAGAAEVFAQALAGRLTVRIGARLPLGEAARAQRALEGRQTTGQTVLLP